MMTSTRPRITAFALFAACWMLGSTGWAHKPSDSYLRLRAGEQILTAEWDIALKDLDFLVGLDLSGDGEITWGEVKQQRQAITAHALSRLSLGVEGKTCEIEVEDLLINRHSDGAYAVLVLGTDCPGDAEELTVDYRLLFDADPTHRGLVLYTSDGATSTHVLTPDSSTLTLRSGEANLWDAFVDYTREGVWHIWIGLDHILFLICLLLPAVLRREENAWRPVEAFGPACWSVTKIVTMFTLAHSITLWLSVMEYVTLPSWAVEATIAASILVTAANNLYPALPLSGGLIAFVFGLIHGFGFASVLLDLGLSDTSLAISLLGFNVGVELGQLAIVLVFMPIAYLLRGTAFYRWAILRGGSILIALIAAIWTYERLANVELLGF